MGNSPLVLLHGARQLLTLRGPRAARRGPELENLAIIPDGALLIRDGIIEDVGPARRIERLSVARHAVEIDAAGHVVMPAFVDSLCRLADRRSDSARETRRAIEHRSRLILDDMARYGTCTVEAESTDAFGEETLFKTLRAYANLRERPIRLAPSLSLEQSSPEEAANFLATAARRQAARTLHLRYAEDRAARAILRTAQHLEYLLKLHAAEFEPDCAAALAVEMNAAVVSGLEYASPADIDVLAASRIIATLSPGASYHQRRDRFAPARALIDRGAAVALASGFHSAWSPVYSMPFVLSLACRYLEMKPAEAIAATTINAAYAAGCGASTGSIEPGKHADFAVLNVRDYRDIAYAAGLNPVYMTIRAGRIIHRVEPVRQVIGFGGLPGEQRSLPRLEH